MLAGQEDLPSLRRAVGACNHSVDADTFDAVWVIVPDRHLVRTGMVSKCDMFRSVPMHLESMFDSQADMKEEQLGWCRGGT